MSPRALARAVLAVALLAAAASAQVVPLDGVWFRVHLHAKGRTVDEGTLKLEKDAFGAKAFLFLDLVESSDGAPGGLTYAWELWTKQDGDVWAVSDSGTQDFVGSGSGDQLAIDLALDVTLQDGRFLSGRATLLFNLKVHKDLGTLKRARIRTLGGETVDGSKDGEDLFVGDLVVKGQDVPVGKLPFDPD